MKFNDVIVSEEKQRLDPHCWSNKKIGNPKTKVKGGVRVNNCVPKEGIEEAMRPIPVDDQGNRIPDRMSSNAPKRPFGQPGDAKSSSQGVVTYTPTGIVHRSNHGDVTPRPRAVPEGSQQVDSLVTDTSNIMQGPEFSDAELAIKTVLGDRAYNERRSYYSFFINQLVDMYGKPEGSKTVDSLVTNALGVMRGPTRNDAIAALKTALGNDEYNSRKTFYKLWINQAVDKYSKKGMAEGFNGEYDDEAGMAQGNLHIIAQAAQGLLDTIDDRDNLPEWAQEKIAKVEGMLVTVWNYLQSQKAQGMDPKVDEGEVKPFVIPDDQTQGNYENQGYRKSPQDRFAVIDYTFNKLILTTNDIKQAKQEAIEWAEYDDIPVAVKNQQTNKVVFKLNGYADAEKYLDESGDPEITEMYEAMQHLVTEMAHKTNVSEDAVWESFEALDDHMLYETAAWRRKEGKSKKGGLNAKGVASYRRENPGSKLQTAVTTKPSKLKPGSKAAKRRKSFCARMSGVKGPAKKPNGEPTRKTLALRKWNC